MEWLTSLFSGGLNLLSGGFVGAVGGIITGWLKLKEKQTDQEFELRMRDKDKELLIAEAENAVKLEQARAQTAIEQGAADAFTASQVNARTEIPAGIAEKAAPWACTGFILSEILKSQVRVFLTLVSFSCVVYFGLQGITEAAKDGKLALACVNSVIFMAELSGGWWFAHRQMTK